jgi:hypothetical protein
MRDRKMVQRQREQQQMAKLMQGDAVASSDRVALTSSIIRKPSRFEDITEEERDHRGAAADAMFQEFKRLIAEKGGEHD